MNTTQGMSDPLPAELRDFLARHIDSIAHLEALLLLRNAADAVWDAQGTARRLYIGEQEASEVLAHLAAQGLTAGDASGYRYDPESEDLREMTELLAEHYKRHLIPITNLIHAKPRRIRQFAEAFKLKKD